MSNLGEFLKTKRLEAGLTIQDISNKTAIRAYIVTLLEEGNFEKLPSYVYAHGFVEQYSRVLGLDFVQVVKPMLDEECSKENFGHAAYQLESSTDSTKDYNTKPVNRTLVAVSIAVIVIIALIVAVVLGLNKADTATTTPATVEQPTVYDVPEPTIPATVDVEAHSDLPTEIQPVEPTAVTEQIPVEVVVATTPADVGHRATLTFTADCWVNLLTDAGTTEDYIAIAGTERYVNFNEYFRIHVGNAGAVTVTFGDDVHANIGGSGQALRNLFFILGDDGTLTRARTAPVAQ